MIELRPYQVDLVGRVRDAFRRHRRVLLQSPTGSGKTVLFAWLARQVAERGRRVVVLVHRRELVRQTGDKLDDFGVPFGTITAGNRGVSRAPVNVASVQTLARRLDHYPGAFDLIVVDEAHHAVAGTWAKVAAAYPNARVLGVTATPQRLDGVGLGNAFDHMELGPSVAELVGQGFLAPSVVYAPAGPDLAGVGRRMGDFEHGALAAAMSKPEVVGDAVAEYGRRCPGAPAIAFCVNVRHASAVADSFAAAGYRAVPVDGTLPDDERDRRILGLADGSVQVLTSCELIGEGLDVPGVAAAILLRPTTSLTVYLQQVGRALRPKPGGTSAVILDHAGNVHRHGLPDEDREWSLAKGCDEQPEKGLPTKECKGCKVRVPRHWKVCRMPGRGKAEVCGYVFPVEVELPRMAEGELVEFRRRKLPMRGTDRVERDRCGSLEEMIEVARRHGRPDAWALDGWRRRAGAAA